jgi:hypothetical protein
MAETPLAEDFVRLQPFCHAEARERDQATGGVKFSCKKVCKRFLLGGLAVDEAGNINRELLESMQGHGVVVTESMRQLLHVLAEGIFR